jgi:hypothetical protein
MNNYLITYSDLMDNYYSKMLLNGFPNDSEIKVQDIPLIINTIDTSYPFAFIDYEEKNVLGVNYTVEDGTERFIVINKEHIINIEILYQQDIDILTEDAEEDSDVMYQ